MGVMGGTFNPIHIAHLRAAEEAIEMLKLDTFVFIPAAVPPHKPGLKIESFSHRWQMLKLATSQNPHVQLSDLECELAGKSYTVKTLNKLRETLLKDTALFFLVGMDAFLELDTWWHYKELFRLAHLVILRRPGYQNESLESFLHRHVSSHYAWNEESGCFQHPELFPVYFLPITHLDISSSKIRRLLAEERSIRYLVPDEVMSYIKEARLYRSEKGEYPENRTC